MSLSRVSQRGVGENGENKNDPNKTMRERERERGREERRKKRRIEQRKTDNKKKGVGESTGSCRKRGIIDPNWMICSEGCLPHGSESHRIINIMTIIHTFFLQSSPGRPQFS